MKPTILIAAVLLASCNREEQPQAPTAAESGRLDEAEEMLDQLANEEGPEAKAPDPSNRSD